MSDFAIVELADPGFAAVQLEGSQLCVDCEWITERNNGRCGRCGSSAVLLLARVLDRENKEGEKDGKTES